MSQKSERQLTSPLFTQEREVIANPFSTSVHQQAAASSSQRHPNVKNPWQVLKVGSCGQLQRSGWELRETATEW